MHKEEEILQEVLETAGDFFISGLKFLKAVSKMISVILQKSGKGSFSELLSMTLIKFSEEIERILKEPNVMRSRKKRKSRFKRINF
jgi:hypothetical protein